LVLNGSSVLLLVVVVVVVVVVVLIINQRKKKWQVVSFGKAFVLASVLVVMANYLGGGFYLFLFLLIYACVRTHTHVTRSLPCLGLEDSWG
jgi:hypothetical protein